MSIIDKKYKKLPINININKMTQIPLKKNAF